MVLNAKTLKACTLKHKIKDSLNKSAEIWVVWAARKAFAVNSSCSNFFCSFGFSQLTFESAMLQNDPSGTYPLLFIQLVSSPQLKMKRAADQQR